MAEVTNIQSKFDFANKLKKVIRIPKQLRIDSKQLDKAEKVMLSYSQEDITKIVQKYSKNLKKLKSIMNDIINKLMEAAKIWLTELLRIDREAYQIIVELEREEFDELKKVETILKKWVDSNKSSIFTKGIIKDLEKGFFDFEKEVERIVGKEIKNDRRMVHGKKPKTGFFTKLKSEPALAKQIRKLDKRAIKEDNLLRKFFDELNHQLDQGIELNFPYLFLKLLHEEGIFEVILDKIKNDLKQLLQDLNNQGHDVLEHFIPLIKIFNGYESFRSSEHLKEMKELYEEQKEQSDKVRQFAYSDYKDEVAIYKEIKSEESIFRYLIGRLNEIEQENIHNRYATQ